MIILVAILGGRQQALLRPGHCGNFAWPAEDAAMPGPLLNLLRRLALPAGSHGPRPVVTADHGDRDSLAAVWPGLTSALPPSKESLLRAMSATAFNTAAADRDLIQREQ